MHNSFILVLESTERRWDTFSAVAAYPFIDLYISTAIGAADLYIQGELQVSKITKIVKC